MFRTTDMLYSISVLLSRKIAKNNRSVSLETCEQLPQHPLHEARYMALVLLNEKFPKKTEGGFGNLFTQYKICQ